jgi:hypothetical protein
VGSEPRSGLFHKPMFTNKQALPVPEAVLSEAGDAVLSTTSEFTMSTAASQH